MEGYCLVVVEVLLVGILIIVSDIVVYWEFELVE